MKDTLELMWHIQLFAPGTPIHRAREYCDRERRGNLAGSVVRWALNFDAEELPDNEWVAWLERRQSLPHVSPARDYWQRENVRELTRSCTRWPCTASAFLCQ